MSELDSERHWTTGRGLLRLWAGVLLGPLAWVLHLNVSYGLATLACAGARGPLLLTTAGTLALAALGGALARQVWGDIGPGHEADGSIIGRSRFMAVGGMALAVLFATIILVQTLPLLLLTRCD